VSPVHAEVVAERLAENAGMFFVDKNASRSFALVAR
jgi:hypothetical protein